MREKAEKRVWILAGLFCLGLCMAVSQPKGWMTVQAKGQLGKWTGMRALASRGNLLYQDSEERVGFFAADFSLLQEKLSSVPEEAFDPAVYGNGSTSEREAIEEETVENEAPEEILEMPEPEEMEEEQEEFVSENDCEEGEGL